VIAVKVNGRALDRAGPAIAAALEIGAATEDIEKGTFLGLRMADNSQHRQRRKQKSKSTDHFFPSEKITICSETGHNCRDFASNEPVTAPFSNPSGKGHMVLSSKVPPGLRHPRRARPYPLSERPPGVTSACG